MNQLLIVLAFILVAALKGLSPGTAFTTYMPGFLYMLVLFLVVSLLFDKYNLNKQRNLKLTVLQVIRTNVAFTGLASILFVLLGVSSVSRMMFFGTIGVATIFELLTGAMVNQFRRLNRQGFSYEPNISRHTPHLNGFETNGNGNGGHTNGREQHKNESTFNGQTIAVSPAAPASPEPSFSPMFSHSTLYRPYVTSSQTKAANPGFSLIDIAVTDAQEENDVAALLKTPAAFTAIHGLTLRRSIIEERGELVFDYLNSFVSLGESAMVLSTNKRMNLLNLPYGQFTTIVNLQRVNDHRWLNKFFETVNTILPQCGYYAGCCETHDLRKRRLFRRLTRVIGQVAYFFDYLIHRVVPKINITQRLYFAITKGKNRAVSRAEVLGRLYCCGFRVVDERYVNGLMYFVAQKMERPCYDTSPTYGPLIKLNRVGKNGRLISVYKLRTMYPYAEYLQHYVFKKNKLDKGGKINNDFRVSAIGKLLRKLWIDELPMIANLLRGELKLVGVRPLSQHYFNLYDPDLQELRMKTKPGLIPPYYADMPKDLIEIMASEKKYLKKHEINPYKTDFIYFWKAVYNIIVRNARST